MMDEETKQICEQLFNEYVKSDPLGGLSMYTYSLAGRAETKLCSLANELGRVKRELDIQKVLADTWRQSYLEQVRDNVKMQAKIMDVEEHSHKIPSRMGFEF